jgi:hypothetical protein
MKRRCSESSEKQAENRSSVNASYVNSNVIRLAWVHHKIL